MLREHEPQAYRNHGQTLARLSQRGGLSPAEAVAIIEGRELDGIVFQLPEKAGQYANYDADNFVRLRELVEQWEAAHA